MKVLVTGGTGFVGNILVNLLCARGDRVTIVTRHPELARTARVGVTYERWLPSLEPFDAIVHLVGESVVAKRWSAAQKQTLRTSRIDSTKLLVDALTGAKQKPRVLVSASAVGYYGDRGEELLDESASPGDDFLARLCVEWEAAARRAEEHGVRVVSVRIGHVLGRSGGALAKMLPIFKLGLGGPLGSGQQWFPWVHVLDLAALIVFAIDRENARGPINAVAPGIVRNKDFARTLGRVLGRPAILPAPQFALRLALGEVATALVASQHVQPRRAQELGFTFARAELEPALHNLLGK